MDETSNQSLTATTETLGPEKQKVIFDVDRFTQMVDFSRQTSLEDDAVATSCIIICTSNCKTGSMSHLTIEHNPIKFVQDLKKKLNANGLPTILIGGWDKDPESKKLLEVLIENLRKEGFVLSLSPETSDTMGNYARKSTLYPNNVLVQRLEIARNAATERLTLNFPSK